MRISCWLFLLQDIPTLGSFLTLTFRADAFYINVALDIRLRTHVYKYLTHLHHRVHTEWQWPLFGVHSILMEKLAQAAWCGWRCTPIPFHYIYHHMQSCGICSSWEGRYTTPISTLYPYLYSVVYTVLFTATIDAEIEIVCPFRNGAMIKKRMPKFILHRESFAS